MRQETIVKTYKYFNEFDETTKNKIIEKYERINEDSWDFISEDLIQDFTTRLESMGYSNIEFQYSGFYSQGDGLSFTAKHGDGDIYRLSSRYSHECTVTSNNKELLESSKKLMNEFYRELQKNYEYLFTKDAIIETIEVNEYEFDIETLKLA